MRRWVILIGLGSVMACGDPNRNKIEFTSRTDEFIFRFFSKPGESPYIGPKWSRVPEYCINDVKVAFQRDPFLQSRDSEAHLFAQDPQQILDRLNGLSDADIKAARWSERTSQPTALASVMVIPYPHSSQPDVTKPLVLQLQSSTFWRAPDTNVVGTDLACHRYTDTNQLSNEGSIKTAVLYQRGMCSRDQELDEILALVGDRLFQEYSATKVDLDTLQNPERVYFHAIPTLGVNEDENLYALRGGFELWFHFKSTFRVLPGEQWGKARYRFTTVPEFSKVATPNGGVLQLSTESVEVHASGGYDFAFRDRLQQRLNDLPGEFVKATRERQSLFVPVVSQVNECRVGRDCGPAATALAGQLTIDKLRAAGVESPTDDHVRRLRCALADPEACTALGRNPQWEVPVRWTCFGHPNNPKQPAPATCNLVVPFRRLNPMTDRLNLVFVDEPDFDSAAYALYVLGFDAEARTAPALCTSRPYSAPRPFDLRGYSVVGWGP